MAKMKFCEHCLEWKPDTEFRRRFKGGSARLNQCRICHNETERVRRARGHREQCDKFVAAFVTRLKNAKANGLVALLCNVMVQHFGGVQGFVNAWTQQIDRIRSEQPGSKKALDFYQAVLRMIEFCDTPQPDITELTDEDLQRELMECTKRLIR